MAEQVGGTTTADPPGPPPAGPEVRPYRPDGPVRRVLRVVSELLLTAGVVVALFVVYQLYVTNLFNAQDQSRLHAQLRRTWAAPAAPVKPGAVSPPLPAVRLGAGLAVLRIPRFGRSYDPVVVEGVDTADLEAGPGHYPGTALPGAVGNFVVSGHRTTYGAPFADLDELTVGDPIVVEVADRWFTYTVTSKEVVLPSDLDVIAPVPDHPGATATARDLTFTTCHPKYSASHRLIVHATLTATTLKTAGLPPALKG